MRGGGVLLELVEDFFSEAGMEYYPQAIETDRSDQQRNDVPSKQLQLGKLKEYQNKVSKAPNMAELENTVNDAINSGMMLNLIDKRGDECFIHYVLERISTLEKNPDCASRIICKLISRGARLDCLSLNKNGKEVLNELELKYKNHKANISRAYNAYMDRTQIFLEATKSATSSKLLDARVDNVTFELKYSEDSIIDMAKITDTARKCGLIQGSIGYGRNIIKIGESEVEVEIKNGMRNYKDLSDNSSIVLTFETSLGKLDIKLSRNDENIVEVKVSDHKKLEQLMSKHEEIGKNCQLGNLSVNAAIKQGFFVRPGKEVCQSGEIISKIDEEKSEEWCKEISKRQNSGRKAWHQPAPNTEPSSASTSAPAKPEEAKVDKEVQEKHEPPCKPYSETKKFDCSGPASGSGTNPISPNVQSTSTLSNSTPDGRKRQYSFTPRGVFSHSADDNKLITLLSYVQQPFDSHCEQEDGRKIKRQRIGRENIGKAAAPLPHEPQRSHVQQEDGRRRPAATQKRSIF